MLKTLAGGLVCALLGVAALSSYSQGQSKAGAKTMPYSAKQLDVTIGDRPVVVLSREAPPPGGAAQITAAEILPGRGMNIHQLTAYIPGKGPVELCASPVPQKAREAIVEGPEHVTNKTFGMGGPILLPWANRIRGKALPDSNEIEALVGGKTVRLPANGRGRQPGAEPNSIHGLLLSRAMDIAKLDAGAQQAEVTAVLDAGDFRGRWPSKTHVSVAAQLKDGKFTFQVTARNTGEETLPMAVGWHPFFAVAGPRAQLRLHLPARRRALVNNYDDVYPTGQLVPVKETAYDFTAPGGVPLNDLFLDDCFTGLERDARGHVVVEVIDRAAGYGVRIRALSKEIIAMQAYAPLNRPVIAIEPQFNLADPFNPFWGKTNTGMVMLKPGQSVTYAVEVEVFIP
jgi:galactose mutarotase-like enzyme